MDTIPKLLVHNAQRFAHKAAVREKEYGIWQTYTWAEACQQVKAIALGLAVLGFQRGDKLAIIGDNRPQLYWGFVAAQSLGGIPVPVYQDAIVAAYVFRDKLPQARRFATIGADYEYGRAVWALLRST